MGPRAFENPRFVTAIRGLGVGGEGERAAQRRRWWLSENLISGHIGTYAGRLLGPSGLQNLHHRFDSGRRLHSSLLHTSAFRAAPSKTSAQMPTLMPTAMSACALGIMVERLSCALVRRQRLLERLLGREHQLCDSCRRFFLHRRDGVRVGIEGDGDGRMAQSLTDDLGMDAGL